MPKTYWLSIQQVSLRGCPDVVGVVNGIFVALEFKKYEKGINEKRAQLQAYNIRKIIEAGGKAYFIYPENEEKILKEIMALYH